MAIANCTLRKHGKPYPRTCSVCGLGPCKEPDENTGNYVAAELMGVSKEEFEQMHLTPTEGPWAVCQDPQNKAWHEGTTIYSVPTGQRVGDATGLTLHAEANAEMMASAWGLRAERDQLRAELAERDKAIGELVEGLKELEDECWQHFNEHSPPVTIECGVCDEERPNHKPDCPFALIAEHSQPQTEDERG